MSSDSLYDDDILLWSEQQAAALRKLARGPNVVPNELDVENVAEEIESVGRSELAAAESYLQLIFVHLIKQSLEPDAAATRHWMSEIFAFHTDFRRRYAPSMRQRIDTDEVWRLAREQVVLACEQEQRVLVAALPQRSPFTIDDMLARRLDSVALAARLAQSQP
jgi:hypothetical protein